MKSGCFAPWNPHLFWKESCGKWSGGGAVSSGALWLQQVRGNICIFRRPLLSAAVEKAEDHHQSPNCQAPPAKMAWLLKSGIICLVLWYIILKLPFNVLSSRSLSLVFLSSREMQYQKWSRSWQFSFEDGKLLWSLLSLVLGLIMRNCEDY